MGRDNDRRRFAALARVIARGAANEEDVAVWDELIRQFFTEAASEKMRREIPSAEPLLVVVVERIRSDVIRGDTEGLRELQNALTDGAVAYSFKRRMYIY